MTRYIEKLLRIVSDMNTLDEHNDIKNKSVIKFMPDELTSEELDMVSAAFQEYHIMEPDQKD